jgi:hypothetical protein
LFGTSRDLHPSIRLHVLRGAMVWLDGGASCRFNRGGCWQQNQRSSVWLAVEVRGSFVKSSTGFVLIQARECTSCVIHSWQCVGWGGAAAYWQDSMFVGWGEGWGGGGRGGLRPKYHRDCSRCMQVPGCYELHAKFSDNQGTRKHQLCDTIMAVFCLRGGFGGGGQHVGIQDSVFVGSGCEEGGGARPSYQRNYSRCMQVPGWYLTLVKFCINQGACKHQLCDTIMAVFCWGGG